MLSIFRGVTAKCAPSVSVFSKLCSNPPQFHTNAALFEKEKRFLSHNEKIYPPQSENETPRQAFVCYQKENLKYSPKKMWYIACMVRGLTIDEAIRQMRFVSKKGALFVLEALLEAQEMAVKQHNVEFKSNLWVAESFVGKGIVVKGLRRHAKPKPFAKATIHYRYCHYFVRLEEGKPPKDYYGTIVTPEQQLEKWLQQKRERKITNSL